jgi:hypothetical protein
VDELGRVFGYVGKVRKAYKILVRNLNERHYLGWNSTNGKRILIMDSCVYYEYALFLFIYFIMQHIHGSFNIFSESLYL